MKWTAEFDLSYAIPNDVIDVLEHFGFADDSWHNDTCPKFTRQFEDFTIQVWIEHPEVDRREVQYKRYQVVLVATFPESSEHGYTLLLTDDQIAMFDCIRGITQAN